MAAGQGTIALEILAELPSTALLTVFVPVGGGGLIAGDPMTPGCQMLILSRLASRTHSSLPRQQQLKHVCVLYIMQALQRC